MSAARSGLFARHSSRLDRAVQIGVASGKVINIAFPKAVPGEATEDHPLLDRLFEYLDGTESDAFTDVEVGLTVPTEHRHVYETVRDIPYGTEWSLDDVITRTSILESSEEATATTARALEANPVPIIVPDHRVRGIAGSTDASVRRALRNLEEIA